METETKSSPPILIPWLMMAFGIIGLFLGFFAFMGSAGGFAIPLGLLFIIISGVGARYNQRWSLIFLVLSLLSFLTFSIFLTMPAYSMDLIGVVLISAIEFLIFIMIYIYLHNVLGNNKV